MPTFCAIQRWSPDGWVTDHAGLNLIDPAAYIARLYEQRGIIARAVEPFTKTVIAEADAEALLENLL